MAGYHVVQPEALERFAAEIFTRLGAPDDAAREVAAHLVRANLAGHDSHGAIRIPQYALQISQGAIQPAARPEVISRKGAALLIDGGGGFGHFATAFALHQAIDVARELGTAVAAIRRANHIGRVGDYAETAARQGFIALLTVGAAGPGVGGATPFGGAQRFLGTNPWSIGIPTTDPQPFLVDFATTVVAEGKVRVARDKHETLPPGCIVDKDGNPSTNPPDFYAGGMLLPFGAHKGYGLAMASALLGGLAAIGDPTPNLAGSPLAPGSSQDGERTGGALLVVIDPGAFGDRDAYAAGVGRVSSAARRVPAAPRSRGVMVPGEPEARTTAERRQSGVSLPDDTWDAIAKLAGEHGVTLPDHRTA
ncbi:MAG TPA: Ldh family oxidoreductase [Chloroflexota bacterium]|nr:Ldh family oxidoreductase [Chloroflexota bacterium]